MKFFEFWSGDSDNVAGDIRAIGVPLRTNKRLGELRRVLPSPAVFLQSNLDGRANTITYGRQSESQGDKG